MTSLDLCPSWSGESAAVPAAGTSWPHLDPPSSERSWRPLTLDGAGWNVLYLISCQLRLIHSRSIYLWVSFLRMGIGPELCPFKKKFGNLLWPNVKSKLCFVNCLWEIFLASLLGKKSSSLWHHYTTLQYTEVYSCTLHFCSIVYKGILRSSVV